MCPGGRCEVEVSLTNEHRTYCSSAVQRVSFGIDSGGSLPVDEIALARATAWFLHEDDVANADVSVNTLSFARRISHG